MTLDTSGAAGPRKRMFANREARLSPEQAKRQGLITHLAFVLLGQKVAIEFLNTYNASLEARPLDLAIADADGYSTVENAVKLLARPASGGVQ